MEHSVSYSTLPAYSFFPRIHEVLTSGVSMYFFSKELSYGHFIWYTETPSSWSYQYTGWSYFTRVHDVAIHSWGARL